MTKDINQKYKLNEFLQLNWIKPYQLLWAQTCILFMRLGTESKELTVLIDFILQKKHHSRRKIETIKQTNRTVK